MAIDRLRAWELVAVVASLGYTWLLIEGSVLCWGFALLASLIYLYLCFVKRIYAESLLQLFYVFTAVYGWVRWQETGGTIGHSMPWNVHVMVILSGMALFLISGFLLKRLTDAATPYVDSFTTVFSIFATLLMIYLIPENWAYWIVIDAVSVYLYFKRKLYFTTALFVLYTALSVKGLIEWTS